jgi:hypothetical protein
MHYLRRQSAKRNNYFARVITLWTLVAALAWPMYLAEMAIIAAIGGAR